MRTLSLASMKKFLRIGLFGSVDTVVDGMVHGWVINKSAPGEVVRIKVVLGNTVVGEGPCDIERPDVAAQFGVLACGFAIPLFSNHYHTMNAKLELYEVKTNQKIRSDDLVLSFNEDWQGSLDGAYDNYLNGSFVRRFPGPRPVTVRAHIDGVNIGTVTSAPQAGNVHPFRFEVPYGFCDGGLHQVHVSLVGENSRPVTGTCKFSPILTPERYIEFTRASMLFQAAAKNVRDDVYTFSFSSRAAYIQTTEGLEDLKALHRFLAQGKPLDRTVSFPVIEDPKYSIVIPMYNQEAVTRRCLAALLYNTAPASYEVILVDDHSPQGPFGLDQEFRNLRLVRADTNLGYLRACNWGAGQARGQYVVMLNNDTEVCGNWLQEIDAVFQGDPKAGAVGSRLLFPNLKVQDAGGLVWGDGEVWNSGRGANQFDPAWSYTREVDYVTGACFATPTDLWNSLGGYSPEFVPAYFEDTDYSFRVREAGWKVVVAPLSNVIHLEGVSNGTDPSMGIKAYQRKNKKKFMDRWEPVYRRTTADVSQLAIAKDQQAAFWCLFIDESVPTPDKDAGSYAAIEEIKLIQALGAKVLFLPLNLAHLGSYTEALQRIGVEVLYAPYYRSLDEVLSRYGARIDLVYITRYQAAERTLEVIRARAKAKVLFNNADLHFLRELRSSLARGVSLDSALDIRDREFQVMRSVDAILSYSETEHAVITSHILRQDNLFLCPWVRRPEPTPTSFEERSGLVFLGGFRHAPNREAVEFFLAKVWPDLRAALPGLTLRILGSYAKEVFPDLQLDGVEVVGYVEDLAQEFSRARLLVAPLSSGAGVKGKVIEAMAYGVPTVLSPVAHEATGLVVNSSTFLASSPEEWVAQITALHSDKRRWTLVRENALQVLSERYSPENGLRLMRKAVESLGIPIRRDS